MAYAALQTSVRAWKESSTATITTTAGGAAAGGVTGAPEPPRTFMKGITALTQQWLNEIGYDEEAASKPAELQQQLDEDDGGN